MRLYPHIDCMTCRWSVFGRAGPRDVRSRSPSAPAKWLSSGTAEFDAHRWQAQYAGGTMSRCSTALQGLGVGDSFWFVGEKKKLPLSAATNERLSVADLAPLQLPMRQEQAPKSHQPCSEPGATFSVNDYSYLDTIPEFRLHLRSSPGRTQSPQTR